MQVSQPRARLEHMNFYHLRLRVREIEAETSTDTPREWLTLELARSGPLRAGLHLAEHVHWNIFFPRDLSWKNSKNLVFSAFLSSHTSNGTYQTQKL